MAGNARSMRVSILESRREHAGPGREVALLTCSANVGEDVVEAAVVIGPKPRNTRGEV